MHEIHTIIHWAALHKDQLLALVGGAGGLSLLLESLLTKLKRAWQIDSKKLAFTLIHVFSAVTAAATIYLSNISGKDGLPIYGTLVLLAETWHRFVISPAYSKWVIPFLNYLSNQKPVATTSTPAVPATPVVPAADPNEFV